MLYVSGVPGGYFRGSDYFGETDYHLRPGFALSGRYDLLKQSITAGVAPTSIHNWTAGVNKSLTPSGNIVGRDGSVHSFVVKALRDEGWDVRLKPGVQEFDVTAPKAGEYLVECTVKCGPGHDNMNFKMIVQ